jgi:rhamnogalacturonyl hydrolase YesR
LYRHGWDESKQAPWADARSGQSAEIWGRGMGWLGMALVDVLAELPQDHPDRPALTQMSRQLADALLQVQDPSGIWWNLPAKPGSVGNYLESSSSAMFVYFLAKGLNDGVLPAEPRLKQAAVRGFQGLLQQTVLINSQGQMQLTQLIQVAGLSNGRDGSAAYYAAEPVYRNDSKGTAPFMMAGVQLAKLLADAP